MNSQSEKNSITTDSIGSFRKIESTPLQEQTRIILQDMAMEMHTQKQFSQNSTEGITACYERLSQEDKLDGESNSIINQKKILEKYCKDHGYTAIRHYDEDDGYSGTNFNRPGFQRMLADIKAGKIKRVVVKDMSRFGRNYLEVGMYTEMIFPQYGVHFIAVNDGVDSIREDNEFTAIRNVFNEMYAKDTSKKIKATFQNKGRSGEHLSTTPPYGYMKDPNDKKKWIVDEEAAAVVQKIFALCIDGLGTTQIAKWLQRNQILNPGNYCYQKGIPITTRPSNDPFKWNSRTVSGILSRIEYLGHTVNFKTSKASFKNKKKIYNEPSQWMIFENTQEPIIPEDVFLTVQNIRKNRHRPTKLGDMGMFSGLVFCADCGGRMYLCRLANDYEHEKDYYICSTHQNDRNVCSQHTIKQFILEKLVLNNLREAIAYVTQYEDEFIRQAEENASLDTDKNLAQSKATLIKSEKRIAELDGIFMHLYEDNLSGKLSDERFVQMSRSYEQEQEQLKKLVEQLKKEINQGERKKTDTKKFVAIVKKYTEVTQLTAAMLREMVEKIYISDAYTRSDKERKIKVREITIVYNFAGAFDFGEAKKAMETV